MFRTHYTEKILTILDDLAQNHEIENYSDSLSHISGISKYINEFSSKHFYDEMYKFYITLKVALFYNDAWKSIDNHTYRNIHKTTEQLFRCKNITNEDVIKSISKLNSYGLKVVPF